jgi:pSer/pThr/pTyr-binding forkhead associated (FHA) protein
VIGHRKAGIDSKFSFFHLQGPRQGNTMPAQLVSLTAGPGILVDKPILLIGRDAECDIQIDSRKVSRRHCCIAQVSDYLVVRDLGSTNGVYVNGVRVAEGQLKPGDELTIANYRFQLHWDLTPQPQRVVARRLSANDNEDLGDMALEVELCEERMVFAEPDGSPRIGVDRPNRDQAGPLSAKGNSLQRKSTDQPPRKGDSNVLPGEIRLAPLSDAFPPGLPEPPSGH